MAIAIARIDFVMWRQRTDGKYAMLLRCPRGTPAEDIDVVENVP